MLRQIVKSDSDCTGHVAGCPVQPKQRKLVWIREYAPLSNTLFFLVLLYEYSFFLSDLDVIVFIIFPAVRKGKTNNREV